MAEHDLTSSQEAEGTKSLGGNPGGNKTLHRLASRLARGVSIDWDAEMRAAGTRQEREAIGKLRIVAAMSIVNRSLLAGADGEEVSASISRAQSVSGRRTDAADRSSESTMVLPPDSRWGQLQVLERVGHGSFGHVYRALDTRLDREVALKIVPASIRDLRSEVVREARLLARVRHPNVVTVFGADRIGDRFGIWTEFLRGQTLDRLIEDGGALDVRGAARIGMDLCRALAAVHAAGIVHQDVKLTNVMRVESGRIVLMDFGLGREAEEGWRRRGRRAITGTPLFMAPEVLAEGTSDARSDLYSLGVVLFALVTASVPFEASTIAELREKHARRERRDVRELRSDLPTAFVEVLERFLAADPEARYQTAGEAEQALYAVLESTTREGAVSFERDTDERVADSLGGEKLDVGEDVRDPVFMPGESGGQHRSASRMAIDATWERLPGWEKSALAQCAVFEGGFSLEAAEAVIDLTAFPEPPWVVDVLQSLVDRFLLRSWVPELEGGETHAAVRFGMSPHVHQFVRAKLDEMDAITRAEFDHEERLGAVVDRARDERMAASAERRHAEWFVRGGRSDAGDSEIVPEASSASSVSGDRSQAIAPSAGQSRVRSPRTRQADLENIVAAARRMAARGEGEIAVSCFRAACSLLEPEGSRTWAIDLGHELLRCPIASDQRAMISTLLDAISNLDAP